MVVLFVGWVFILIYMLLGIVIFYIIILCCFILPLLLPLSTLFIIYLRYKNTENTKKNTKAKIPCLFSY